MAGLVRDTRRWDFSIVDDEFTDTRELTPFARAAYLSIVRHARVTGDTDQPTADLMAGAGIGKVAAWRRARRQLVALAFVKVERRAGRTDRYVLLPVPKRREPRPKGTGVGEPTLFPWDRTPRPKGIGHPGPKGPGPIVNSEILREGEKSGSTPGHGGDRTRNGPELTPAGERFQKLLADRQARTRKGT